MAFDIYITGVGGQGIGLLSHILVRAGELSGQKVLAVDTHGLAQRGGTVVSRIRFSSPAHSPLTRRHSCGLVLAMEIHEALRGAVTALSPGGTLVYLDLSWQPLPVRLGQAEPVRAEDVASACRKLSARCIRIALDRIEDPRMQNMALIGTLSKQGLIPGITGSAYAAAIRELVPPSLLDRNMAVFQDHAT